MVRRWLPLLAAALIFLPFMRIPAAAQDEGGTGEAPVEQPVQDNTEGSQEVTSEGEQPAPAQPEGDGSGDVATTPQPDGESGPVETSGGGDVIATGEPDAGPDNGGLVDSPPPPKARSKRGRRAKGKAKPAARRKAQLGLPPASSSPPIPAARFSAEPVRPIEPLPVVALSPIAPYNP